MATQETRPTEYCSGLINCAQLVLKLSHDEIKEGYSDNPMYVKEYIQEGGKENIIDIMFDDPEATLSCTFDENNTCNSSYIFFDNLEEIDSYINYLRHKYDYDYINSRWILPNSYLSVRSTKNDIFFVSFC